MFVATLGKIPLFLLFLLSRSDSSSSPVLGEVMAPSRPSPVGMPIKVVWHKLSNNFTSLAAVIYSHVFEPFSSRLSTYPCRCSCLLCWARADHRRPAFPEESLHIHPALVTTTRSAGRHHRGEKCWNWTMGNQTQVCGPVSPALTGWNRSRWSPPCPTWSRPPVHPGWDLWAFCPSGRWCSDDRSCRRGRAPSDTQRHAQHMQQHHRLSFLTVSHINIFDTWINHQNLKTMT